MFQDVTAKYYIYDKVQRPKASLQEFYKYYRLESIDQDNEDEEDEDHNESNELMPESPERSARARPRSRSLLFTDHGLVDAFDDGLQ